MSYQWGDYNTLQVLQPIEWAEDSFLPNIKTYEQKLLVFSLPIENKEIEFATKINNSLLQVNDSLQNLRHNGPDFPLLGEIHPSIAFDIYSGSNTLIVKFRFFSTSKMNRSEHTGGFDQFSSLRSI